MAIVNLRLIPCVIVATSVLLPVKLGSIWFDMNQAVAATAEKKSEAASKEPEAKPKRAPEAKEAPKEAAAAPAKPRTEPGEGTGKANAAQKFSPSEVELLQELSKRRAELDERAEAFDRRELLLKAAEQRVDEKIEQLKQLQADVNAAMGKIDEQDEQRIKSLVHIYENMKPKEAAQIFAQLDQKVLLQVLTRMKDLKTAAILASMDPEKARSVTVALAEKKQLSDTHNN